MKTILWVLGTLVGMCWFIDRIYRKLKFKLLERLYKDIKEE